MTSYFSILGTQIAGLVGPSSPHAPLPTPLQGSNHWQDAAIAPLLALISPSHDPLVPRTVVTALTNLTGKHTSDCGCTVSIDRNPRSRSHSWTGSAYSPPFDFSRPGSQRNYTAFTADGLSMGAIEINEARIGGPALSNESFNPVVVQWNAKGVVGYISVGQRAHIHVHQH